MKVYPAMFSGIMVVLKRKANISNSSKQLLYAVRRRVCQTLAFWNLTSPLKSLHFKTFGKCIPNKS